MRAEEEMQLITRSAEFKKEKRWAHAWNCFPDSVFSLWSEQWVDANSDQHQPFDVQNSRKLQWKHTTHPNDFNLDLWTRTPYSTAAPHPGSVATRQTVRLGYVCACE